MPVQIGAQTHSFSDPTGLLSDCHRRIEMFLGSLQRLAEVVDRPLTDHERTALESADQFRLAVSDLASIYGEHIRVEDELVFPTAKQRLSGPQQSAIANEMASRRHLRS